jgi:hypothetical protein
MSTDLKQAILEMRAAAVARRCRINHIEVTAGYALDAVRTLDDARAYQMCRMQGVAVRREGVSEGEASLRIKGSRIFQALRALLHAPGALGA